MKKIIAGSVLMLITTASYATAYQCTGYVAGTQVGEPLTVQASKKAVAEAKAYSRFKKADIKVEYIDCK